MAHWFSTLPCGEWGAGLDGAGQEVERGTPQVHWPGLGAVLGPGSPHLHRTVAQLNGLVDALHDLAEACGEGEEQGPGTAFLSPTSSHP